MKSSCLCNLRYFPPPLSAEGLGNTFPHLPQGPRGIMRESHLILFDAVALQSSFLGPSHRWKRGWAESVGWTGRGHSDAHPTTSTSSLPSNTELDTSRNQSPSPSKPRHLHREEVLSGLLKVQTKGMKGIVKNQNQPQRCEINWYNAPLGGYESSTQNTSVIQKTFLSHMPLSKGLDRGAGRVPPN